METKYLVMSFKNEQGKKINLTIRGIKDTLTEAEVIVAMDSIISKNIFLSSGGKLVEKVKADIITRNVNQLVGSK
ncbi:hypothetical protein CPJCM30710_31800 [Clostridium polyendosporum]|uniref:DUF2922 domain-containing protein n=1 Tax=Clostridium polyendosporum TaxID=69208 RepID=A0A919S2Y8_9CLOT|nr:DUF2922 domain-containing protein [Clostridium polyendosporum]GIM30514.1 hypothetical protein CPJCM30710_31800 [Clostridium polyendosporum]